MIMHSLVPPVHTQRLFTQSCATRGADAVKKDVESFPGWPPSQKGPQNFPMSDPIDVETAARLARQRMEQYQFFNQTADAPEPDAATVPPALLPAPPPPAPSWFANCLRCLPQQSAGAGPTPAAAAAAPVAAAAFAAPPTPQSAVSPSPHLRSPQTASPISGASLGPSVAPTMVLSPSVSAHGYLLPDEALWPGPRAMPLTCNAPTSPGTTTSDRGVQKPPKLVMSPTAATLRPYLHRSPTSLSRSPGTEHSSTAVEEGKRASVHNRLHELHAHKLAELELRRQESVNAVYLHSLPLRQRAEMDARPFGTSSHQSQQSPRSPPPPAQPHRGASTMSVGGNRSPKSPPTSPRQLSRQMSLGTTQTSGGLFLSSARGGGLDGTPGPGAYPADNSSSFKPPSPSGGFNLSGGTGSSRTLNRSSSNGRIESRSPGTSAAFKSAVPRTALPAPRNGPGPAAYSPPRADSSAPLGGVWSRSKAARFEPEHVALDRLQSPGPHYYTPRYDTIGTSSAQRRSFSAAPGSVLE